MERRGSRHSSASRDGGRRPCLQHRQAREGSRAGADRAGVQAARGDLRPQRARPLQPVEGRRLANLSAGLGFRLRNLEGPDDGVRKPGLLGERRSVPRSQRPRSPAQQHRRAAAAHVVRRAVTLLPDSRGVRRVADPSRISGQDDRAAAPPTVSGTALQNNTTDKPATFTVRNTTLLLVSEPLALAEVAIGDAVSGDTVTLERHLPWTAKPDNMSFLPASVTDLDGAVASEVRDLKEVTVEGRFTGRALDPPLDHVYRRQRRAPSTRPRARPSRSTPTSPRDARRDRRRGPRQRRRRQPTSASRCGSRRSPTSARRRPSGAESTLEVRVERRALGRGRRALRPGAATSASTSSARRRRQDHGACSATASGARLPTGQENVTRHVPQRHRAGRARSRRSADPAATRPLGVRGRHEPAARRPARPTGEPRDEAAATRR